jgi:hypothetical protein
MISVPEDLLGKMIHFGISPSATAKRAFSKEVKAREDLIKLAKAREKDPRINLDDLHRGSKRIRKLLEE